jgi:hypothetical protein
MLAGLEPVLVSCTLRVELAPTRTLPKSREVGATARVDRVEVPVSEMNSSEVAELEEISIALACVPLPEPGCGVKVIVRGHVAPGTTVEQGVETVKSGVVWMLRMLSGAVPVLVSVTVCGAEVVPGVVLAKVSESCERAIAAWRAVFEGDEMVIGVELPLRSIRSGLDAASLSMMSEPESDVDTGELETAVA